MYHKNQYFVDQVNYPDAVIAAVVMITSFGKNSWSDGNEDGGDKNTSKTDAIVSLHSADDINDCSNDNDGSIGSFESKVLNNGKASNNNISIVNVPVVANKLGNDDIDDDVVTDDIDDGNNDGNNEDDKLSSNNNNDDSNQEESISDSVSATSATSPLESDTSSS